MEYSLSFSHSFEKFIFISNKPNHDIFRRHVSNQAQSSENCLKMLNIIMAIKLRSPKAETLIIYRLDVGLLLIACDVGFFI